VSAKNVFRFAAASMMILGILFAGMSSAHADDEPACLKCHENLYYLHDTGKWYCISEARDRCVLCHGGNPNTLDKEEAHYNRAAHPVVNEDISRCQQCHPADCDEHVVMFRQVAGIKPVYVAVAYTPSIVIADMESAPEQRSGPNWEDLLRWSLTGGVILLLAIGVTLLFCKIQDRKHPHL
jgi:hypothetical protein